MRHVFENRLAIRPSHISDLSAIIFRLVSHLLAIGLILHRKKNIRQGGLLDWRQLTNAADRSAHDRRGVIDSTHADDGEP